MSRIQIREYRTSAYAILRRDSHGRLHLSAWRSTYAQALQSARARRRATGRPHCVRQRTQIYQTLTLALPFSHPWR